MGKKLKTGVVATLCIILVVLLGVVFSKFQHWRNARVQAKAGQAYALAEQLRLDKKYDPAIQEYKNILDKYPQYNNLPEVYFKIANIYIYQLVNIDEAQRFYTELLRFKNKFPHHKRIPDAMIELALIYRAKQKYNDAISLLEEADAKYPGQINKNLVYYQLFILYGQIGEKKKMEEMFRKRGTL